MLALVLLCFEFCAGGWLAGRQTGMPPSVPAYHTCRSENGTSFACVSNGLTTVGTPKRYSNVVFVPSLNRWVRGGSDNGDGLHVQYSDDDGVSWTSSTSGSTILYNMYALAYGGGQFVGGGNSLTRSLMTSPNGITWTGRAAAMFEGSSGSVVHGIAYSANLSIWVAVGAAGNGAAAGRIASSADGIVWTTRNSGFTGDGVAFGLGRFTAVGGLGTANTLVTSVDGIQWTGLGNSTRYSDIKFVNGRFYGAGYHSGFTLGYSDDGLTFVGISTPGKTSGGVPEYGNGLWLYPCFGNVGLMTSADGLIFTDSSALVSGNGSWVAFGEYVAPTTTYLSTTTGVSLTSATTSGSTTTTQVSTSSTGAGPTTTTAEISSTLGSTTPIDVTTTQVSTSSSSTGAGPTATSVASTTTALTSTSSPTSLTVEGSTSFITTAGGSTSSVSTTRAADTAALTTRAATASPLSTFAVVRITWARILTSSQLESLPQIVARFLSIDVSRVRIVRPITRQSSSEDVVFAEVSGSNAGALANQLVSGAFAAYAASSDSTLPAVRSVSLVSDVTTAASSELSAGAIAGIVIGAVLGVGIIVLIAVLIARHARRRSNSISGIKHNPLHQNVPMC